MRLAHMTWQAVEAYLRERDAVVLPVGSTEQHGPTGLLGTDHLTAEGIALAAGERTGTPVAPVLPYGMSNHHMAFPGTVTLQPSTYMAVVRDVIASLHRHGFRRFYFVNGHGGNEASLEAGFSETLERLPDARIRLVSWWKLPEVQALEQELFGDRNGLHATPSEISLTMHLCPGTVEPGDSAPAGTQACAWPLSPQRFRECFPDGRMGSDPSLATAEAGERLFACAVEAVVKDLERFTEAGG